jgi:FecR protein
MCRTAFFCCVTLCIGLVSGCWQGVSRQVVVTVLSVRGAILYRSLGQADFHPLGSEAKPGVGSVLLTSANGWLDLALIPGTLVQVSPNSELEIEELRLRKEGNETRDEILDRLVEIRLNRGTIDVLFELRDKSVAQLSVATNRVTVVAKPSCLFRIQADEWTTRVTCVHGIVYSTQAPPIPFGYFQEWPSAKGKAAVANDSRSKTDFADIHKAEQELRNLQSRKLLRLPY